MFLKFSINCGKSYSELNLLKPSFTTGPLAASVTDVPSHRDACLIAG